MNTWLFLTSIVATFGIIVAIIAAIVIGEFDRALQHSRSTRPRINLAFSAPKSSDRWIGRYAYYLFRGGKAKNRVQAIHRARMERARRMLAIGLKP